MKKIALAIASTLMLAPLAHADAYVGFKFGQSWLNDSCIAGQKCNDNKETYGLFAGYQFTPMFALETSGEHFGSYADTALGSHVRLITLAPKLSYQLTDNLAVYGKLGAAYARFSGTYDYSYLGAAGLELSPINNLALRLEYQNLPDISRDIRGEHIRGMGQSVTLGVSFKFGSAPEAEPAPVVVEEEVVVEPVVVAPVTKTFESKLLLTEQFPFNSTTPENSEALSSVITFLNTYPQAKVTVTGYTDSQGSSAFNQKLSEKRAEKVKTALVDNGVENDRITTAGKGEADPIASNDTLEGRKQNRRVDINVEKFEYQEQQ